MYTENLDLFQNPERWPKKPYCSADKTASQIRTLRQAITRPYIQANPPHLRVWSIYDVARAGGAIAWEDAMLPPPTWATKNRENGHAHLVYRFPLEKTKTIPIYGVMLKPRRSTKCV